jgi:hypothetical protein
LTFLKSASKEDSFDTHHDHIQGIKNYWYTVLGLGFKFEVGFGIGFLINFHAILDLAIVELILNITFSRLLILFQKLKIGGPYHTSYRMCKQIR